MSFSDSLAKFKKETADAASRNLSHSRPATSTPVRTSTPKPAADSTKRTHDAAFSTPPTAGPAAALSEQTTVGKTMLSHMNYARDYLKKKLPHALPFDEIIRHLSLPMDLDKNIPHIRSALINDDRVEFLPKGTDGATKDMFKYRPKIPVSNADELRAYFARQDTAHGIPVSDLKDGWPDCVPTLNKMEAEHAILVIRQKKENIPKIVYADSPNYHIHVDDDFRDYWLRTKLPATEGELRSELEKAQLTPTSVVKAVTRVDNKKKDRKKPNRRGGKTTNTHMRGILKNFEAR